MCNSIYSNIILFKIKESLISNNIIIRKYYHQKILYFNGLNSNNYYKQQPIMTVLGELRFGRISDRNRSSSSPVAGLSFINLNSMNIIRPSIKI